AGVYRLDHCLYSLLEVLRATFLFVFSRACLGAARLGRSGFFLLGVRPHRTHHFPDPSGNSDQDVSDGAHGRIPNRAGRF
ncbi:MAG: hypothetical protein ACREQ3_03680, partial [Candidatus Binatia bacterium]